MPCVVMKLENGATAIVKLANAPRKKCSVCGKPGDLLCDYPVRGHTCDKPLCCGCAIHKGYDTDWCPDHGPVPQLELLP